MSVDSGALHSVSYPDWIAPRIEERGLQRHLHELVENGFTVLENAASAQLTKRVRAAIVRCADETVGAGKGRTASLLLGRDPVFEEAVLLPDLYTLMECLLGRGMLLSQLIGSIRGSGDGALPVHCDNNWLPAPFPDWDVMLTACWACDEFTEAGGSTKVIPGSHRHRRHPSREESKAEVGAAPIECPAGSLAIWNAAVWHGNYPRKLAGDRVVLHMTYTRLSFRPVEDYGHLDDDWLAGKPAALATLLGRDDFLEHRRIAEGFADPRKLAPVFASVQSPESLPRKR